jgi:hypothetical protein
MSITFRRAIHLLFCNLVFLAAKNWWDLVAHREHYGPTGRGNAVPFIAVTKLGAVNHGVRARWLSRPTARGQWLTTVTSMTCESMAIPVGCRADGIF